MLHVLDTFPVRGETVSNSLLRDGIQPNLQMIDGPEFRSLSRHIASKSQGHLLRRQRLQRHVDMWRDYPAGALPRFHIHRSSGRTRCRLHSPLKYSAQICNETKSRDRLELPDGVCGRRGQIKTVSLGCRALHAVLSRLMRLNAQGLAPKANGSILPPAGRPELQPAVIVHSGWLASMLKQFVLRYCSSPSRLQEDTC
jgi:hypothetical protein